MSIRVENPLIAAALAQRLAVSRFLQRDNEQGGQSVASEGQSIASKPQRSKVVRAKRKTTLQNQLLSLIRMMSPGHTFGSSELVSTNADYAFKTLCEEGWIKRIGSGRFKVLRCPSSSKALIPEKMSSAKNPLVYKVRA